MATVSIVIPVYNTEEYLEACLNSVRHQTFRDFEAIIINDGSTDNSAKIIENFVKSDKRFKAYHQENEGLSEARNSGISKANSPWITFVDSDDIIAPHFLEALLEVVHDEKADIVCCGTQTFSESPAKHLRKQKVERKNWTPEEALTQALYQDRIPDHSAWNKLYAIDLWKKFRFPKGKVFEDLYTIPRIFLNAKKICTINSPLYFYRIREASILNSAYDLKKAELLSIAEETLDFIKNNSQNKRLLRAAQNMLVSTSFSILKRTPDTENFRSYRDRAWSYIKKLRWQNLIDVNVRLRNKMADIISFAGIRTLSKMLEKDR